MAGRIGNVALAAVVAAADATADAIAHSRVNAAFLEG
jgi:hypothetical protein